MNKLKAFLARALDICQSDTTKQYVRAALPYVDMVAGIIVNLTPTYADNAAYALIKAHYPGLADPGVSEEEKKRMAREAVSMVLKKKFPGLPMTDALIATQLAYKSKKPEVQKLYQQAQHDNLSGQ